ncbi:MAG: hypothetical protein E7369_01020 [Clostridiales bacterium]|nr:hypothetical protein [Clostridiales bacterium]
MIDIHTHILPCVDDGSVSAKASLAMLKEEVAQGVDSIVLTPHYRASYTKSKEELLSAFEDFKQAVKAEGIPVELYLGQEIFVSADTKNLLKENKLLTLNNSRFVLVEFDFLHRCEIAEVVHELKCEGFKPIVAHPERYDYVTLEDAYEIKTIGGFLQVNAESIVGENKRVYKKLVKGMFKEGFVDFVASDIHTGRKNFMESAFKHVKRKFGNDAAEVVFNLDAKQILRG